MGFVSGTITLVIGYFAIQFIKNNKEHLKDIPIVKDYVKDEKKEVSKDAYLIVFAFALKDFLF
jgi:hypothetical protein